jgi:hypothetical protein
MFCGMRRADPGERWLEKAVKDEARIGPGEPRRDFLVEQQIQTRPKLLKNEVDGNLRKRVGVEHFT